MKKVLTLLVALAMMLTLCACGGAAPAESPAGGSAGTEAADQAAGKNYVEKVREFTVRVTEEGVREYLLDEVGPVIHSGQKISEPVYDEYGNETGENVNYIGELTAEFLEAAENIREWGDDDPERSAEFDDAGAPVSVTQPGGMEYNYQGKTFFWNETGIFENGRLTRIEQVVDPSFNGTADKLGEITFEYHPDGALARQTTSAWIVPGLFSALKFEEPLVSVLEFDTEGRCTLMREEDVDWDNGVLDLKEYRWTYEGAGGPVALELREGTAPGTPADWSGAEVTRTATMAYDEAGRMTSAEKTEKGVRTAYAYSYNGDGVLTSVTRTADSGEVRSVYEYDENGGLIADRRTVNGAPAEDVLYTWQKDEYGINTGTLASGDRALSVIPTSSVTLFAPVKEKGHVTWENVCFLTPSAVTLEPVYLDLSRSYEYDFLTVLVEAEPEAPAAAAGAEEAAASDEAAAETADLLAAYYPPLNGSYCGIPVPTPDGSQRLVRVHSSDGLNLDVAADVAYNEDGTVAGVTDSFDPVSSVRYTTQTADEQGRLATYKPMETRTLEYRYGDDPAQYVIVTTDNGNVSEREVKLDYERIPAWIQRIPEARESENQTIVLNEDGLVAENTRKSTTGDVFSDTYTYTAETYPNGALKAVIQNNEEYGYSWPVIEFDPAGYLITYVNYTYVRTVTYTYEAK